VGGQLTCHGALELHGVWVVRDSRLHVAVNRDATQLRTPHDPRRRREPSDGQLRVHWRRTPSAAATVSAVAPVEVALADYARCAPAEHVAAAVDSALHLGLLGTEHPLAIPFHRRGIDGTCESGIETIFWLRMQRHRLPTVRQARFRGLGRVDFLIGERLIIEVDGQEFHDKESSFESDRRRDATLSTLGYRVLRFSYSQVMSSWPLVEAAVLAAISRGDHLR
jgi:very-short-patch-repair endonuclease